MMQIINFNENYIKSTEYLFLNLVISRYYLYVIYYDTIGIPVVIMYKFKKELKTSVYGSTIFRVGTINRNNKNYMALTNGSISIVRDSVEPASNDLVLSEDDYRSLMALIFKSKLLYDENRYYTTLEY